MRVLHRLAPYTLSGLLFATVSLAATAPAKPAAGGSTAKTSATGTAAAKTPAAKKTSTLPVRPEPVQTMMPKGTPRLLMSWKAPWGQPGAASNLDASPCDSNIVDTLYLSVDPGKDAPRFLGLDAVLYLHAPEGSELPTYWKSDDYEMRRGKPLRVVFENDEERNFIMPFNSQGMGGSRYDYTTGSGRLRWVYTVAAGANNPVKKGKIFAVARVLVRRPQAGTSGCGKPICVEWHYSHLTYDLRDEPVVRSGELWATINAGGSTCATLRSALGPKPWRPKP
jgi:hypothetical protein